MVIVFEVGNVAYLLVQIKILLIQELDSSKQGRYKQLSGHDVNLCNDLPRRASEIQFSLALLQLSLALEKLYIIIL